MEGFFFYICIYFAEMNLELQIAPIVVHWDAGDSQGEFCGIIHADASTWCTSVFNSMHMAAFSRGMGADADWSPMGTS